MDFLEKKEDTKEIVMFFKKDYTYDRKSLADEITKRYPELGEPSFIEKNGNFGLPIFCFMDNPEMFLAVAKNSVSISFHDKYFDKLATIIFDIVDAFNDSGIEFVRLGYISNNYLPSNKVDIVKNRFLVKDQVENMIDFNIGWYRQLDTKFGKINCWEKYMTEKKDGDSLLLLYDFNTIVDYEFDFELKSIKEFLNVANAYIESRIEEL